MKTIKTLAIALAVLSLGSCEKENLDDQSALAPDSNPTVLKNFEGAMIEVEDLGSGTYQLGDIKFAENQFSADDFNPDPFAGPEEFEAKLNLGRGVKKWENNRQNRKISLLKLQLLGAVVKREVLTA